MCAIPVNNVHSIWVFGAVMRSHSMIRQYLDRLIGFSWINGEQSGEGGPLEILNTRYYCNPRISSLLITKAYSNGPCQFRIEIDSKLACVNETNHAKPEPMMRLHDAHFFGQQ